MPTEQQVDAYRDAAVLLLSRGFLPAPNLPAMRHLWRRGGTDQRIAQLISERWQVAA